MNMCLPIYMYSVMSFMVRDITVTSLNILLLGCALHYSYISDATREAGAAEARKKEKYALLYKSHHFVPIAIN